MIGSVILIILIIAFAMNMGASGVAPSFSAVCGAGLISRNRALFLFFLFVLIGAVLMGRNVSLTLSQGVVPSIDFNIAVIVVAASTLGLLLANLAGIPQSTSQVTIGALVGVGLYVKNIEYSVLVTRIFPTWLLLPLFSYLITRFIWSKVYPPDQKNLYIYERFLVHEGKTKVLMLIASCYIAFAIGSNNTGNAVGMLAGAGIVGIIPGLLLVSPFFGLGALVMGRGNLKTAGSAIVPLGILSGIVVAFVTASLLIFASLFGVPQSLVQLNIFAIFAISGIKNGDGGSVRGITKKIIGLWTLTPLVSLIIAYLLMCVNCYCFNR